MALSISFDTTGREYQSDIDLIGGSTFLEEAAKVNDITKFKYVLSQAFRALDVDLDSHYTATLEYDNGSLSVSIQKTAVGAAPTASEFVAEAASWAGAF